MYRREAEKLKPPAPVYIRVKAPPGIGAVWRSSGAGERARFEPSIPAKWPRYAARGGSSYSIIAAWVKLQLDPIFFLWSTAA